MKHSSLVSLAFISVLIIGTSFCDKEDCTISSKNNNEMTKVKIKITVNNRTFNATLLDNNSAKSFKEMLPLTINMIELNGNEKYFNLQKSLPTNRLILKP